MTVLLGSDGHIRLSGVALAEDAEPLLRLLLDNPEAAIDWRGCQSCHTAVLQVILAARKPMLGPPAGEMLGRWLAKSI